MESSAKCKRGQSIFIFERRGKIGDFSVSELKSNFLNGQVRFGQQMPCFADPKFL